MGKIIKRFGVKSLTFLVLIFVYWQWILPGVRVSNDLTYVSSKSLLEQFDLPRLWHDRGSEGMGQFGIFILWSWPFNVFSGLLSKIGLNFSVQIRLIYILPIIVLGVFGIIKILKKSDISQIGIFISSIFYLTTTYLLLLIDGGQLSIALAYALLPLLYVNFTNALKSNLRSKLIIALLLSLLVSLDVRILFILFIILLARFLFELIDTVSNEKWPLVRRWVISSLTIGIFVTLLNYYWIAPFLKYPLSNTTFSQLTQNVGNSSTTWKHAFLLLQPQWYLNVFGVIPQIKWEFIIIPLFVFISPTLLLFLNFSKGLHKTFLNKKTKSEIVFWFFIALIGIFLSKGTNPPLGNLYQYLFDNVPGFSLFRDSTKFFFLISISYSILIGNTIDIVLDILKRNSVKGRWTFFVPFVISGYLIFLVSPVWLGKMTGMFSKTIYKNEYKNIWNILEDDGNFGRVLWLPSIPPLGYFNPTHPAVEGLRLLSYRPFAIGVVGSYEQLNYLREASYIGEILKVAGIKYISYPYPDTRRIDMKKDNIDYYYSFFNQISNLPYIGKTIYSPPVPLLYVKNTKDRLFIADNSYYVIGSDRLYQDLIKINGFDLSNNAIIFAEEKPQLLNSINPGSKILIYDKDEYDLVMSFIERNSLYFPADYLKKDPTGSQKWWKRETSDIVWWRDFLQTKYGIDNLDFDFQGGWAVSEGDLQLSVSNDQFSQGKILSARIMKSSKGGRVEFWQGENKVGEVNTWTENPEKVEIRLAGYKDIPEKISIYDKADFQWFEIGNLVDDSQLTIKTYGDVNVINAISVIPRAKLDEIKAKVGSLIGSKQVLFWSQLNASDKETLFSGDSGSVLTYKRLNATLYEVNVNKLEKPGMLVFSETFNNLWNLNGKSSEQVYSTLNGFYIDKQGKYTLNFAPQRYVYPGLAVSLITLLIIVGLIIYTGRNKV